VDLPFLRDLGPAHPGLRVELGGTTVLVSRGLGVVGLPLRTGVPAEVSFVTLRATPVSE
jgi:predicted MPP superfamily phosphohydrolase